MAIPADVDSVNSKAARQREYIIGFTGLALTIALCVLVIIYWDDVISASRYGYLGVFFVSILSGATILIPVPGLLIVFTLGSILHPAIVGALAGLGEAFGSITIYLAGYGGHRAVEKLETIDHRFIIKFEDWLRQRGTIAVFLMSSIFNPFFYPFVAIAGAMHFSLAKFFFLCWGGKTIKGMGVAYLGYYSLGSLLNWAGIGV
jgi:membrane protein DedA with SNARE-associated domain